MDYFTVINFKLLLLSLLIFVQFIITTAARRRLAPFQVCSQCRSCSGNTCKTMPCCYGINYNIPNKPYGYCAFQPKKCDCNPCATA
ncbi:hypothetical protein ACB092_01G009000 [Castanea dentata]